MEIIEKRYNGQYFVCIRDENRSENVTKEENGKIMIGFFGLMGNGIPAKPATMWFDETMKFISAEEGFNTHNCEHCQYRDGLKIPDECLYYGHSVKDIDQINICEGFKNMF